MTGRVSPLRFSIKSVHEKLRSGPLAMPASTHAVRLLTVAAKLSFWAAAYRYFGVESLLHLAAAGMFLFGIKDLTQWRIRLWSLNDPARRRRAALLSFFLEALLAALRVAIIFAAVAIIGLFNRPVANLLGGLAILPLLWSRETTITLASVFGVGQLANLVGLVGALGGLAAMVLLAERGFGAVDAAVLAMIVREGLQFVGFGLAILAARLGFRMEGEAFDVDEGGTAQPVTGPDGNLIRSTWKILIADNVVWSRWRLVQFATRYAAAGVFGPFGGIATRILFAYQLPGAYVHKTRSIATWKLLLLAACSLAMLTGAAIVAHRLGVLNALGITLAGFLFRAASLVANSLLWRQLEPLVAREDRIPLPGERLFRKR